MRSENNKEVEEGEKDEQVNRVEILRKRRRVDTVHSDEGDLYAEKKEKGTNKAV